MPSIPFSGIKPSKYIWVSTNGSNSNSGNANSPIRSIQAAVDKATPGTAVMVKAGTYVENVQFKKDGAPNAPIWLISADGAQKATVKAASSSTSTIYGYGEDNIVVKDLLVMGGKNGIQFSQSGTNHTNYTKNIVIQGNKIVNAREDGVKISQGDNIHVVDNVTDRTGDQGIDYVAVNGSVIARNEVKNVTGSSGGIFAKATSTNVLIEKNWVHGARVDGIVVGGWSDKSPMRPGNVYEAKNIIVTGNIVEDVGKRPLNILGARDSKIHNNFFEANSSYGVAVNVGPGSPAISPRQHSNNIEIFNNVFTRKTGLLAVEPGSKNIDFHDNRTDGKWYAKAGPYSAPASSGGPAAPVPPALPQPAEPGQPISPGGLKTSTAWTKKIIGTDAADKITGTTDNDLIDGDRAIDTMTGGKGDDTYVVGSRYDKVVEKPSEGTDTVQLWDTTYTLPENMENLLIKTDKTKTVEGNELPNIIQGKDGTDIIKGGGGADQIHGGKGRDIFVYGTISDKGDQLMDFDPDQDFIDLRQLKKALGDGALDVDFKQKSANSVAMIVEHGGKGHEIATLHGLKVAELGDIAKGYWLVF